MPERDRDRYRAAFSRIGPKKDFEERTLALLEREAGAKRKETMKKKTRIIYGAAAAALALVLGGLAFYKTNAAVPPEAARPPIAAKSVVNIDGIIDEVSPDGTSFRIGTLWVTVDENTQYGISEPTGLPADEQLVSKVFKAGNAVSGFTRDDPASGKVYASRIYNNFPPQG